MKKNNSIRFLSEIPIIRIMKIYTILLCFTMVKISALDVKAQNISLDIENTELKNVIIEIEDKSEYSFFYNNNLIDVSRKISLSVIDKDIEEILQNIFTGTEISYKILKKHIVLFPTGDNSIYKKLNELLREEQRNKENTISSIPYYNLKDLIPIYYQGLITGVVTDQQGVPLPGVAVVVKGTSIGTQTDFDGRYQIEAKRGDVLTFSYVGMTTENRTISNSTEISVTLSTSVNELEEVVLLGYSTQKKERVTGAAEIIDVTPLQNAPRAAFQESLQGNATGVHVIANSGQPGATPNVRIRGVGSFESSAPLYIVDGIQVDSGDLTSLNSSDFEAVSVLKDAAATSIYGARAANGVIVIKTKSGKEGRTRINYNTQSGFSNTSVADRFKPLSTPELQELLVEGVINSGRRDNPQEALDYLVDRGFNPQVNTNWFDEITRVGRYQEHNLSVSGGSEKTKFYLSGGYYKQTGVIEATSFERMSSRLKLEQDIFNDIKIGANFAFSKSINNTRPDAGAFANPVRSIYRIRPDFSVYNEDGTYNIGFNGTHNPVAQANEEIRRSNVYRFLGGADLNWNITQDLSVEVAGNINYGFVDDFIRRPAEFGSGRPLGDGFQDSDFLLTWSNRNLIRYNRTFNDTHNITAFAGYEITKFDNKYTALGVENIISGSIDLGNGVVPTEASTEIVKRGLNSWFSNAEYSYDDKYIISGSLRRDGSSRFAEKNKYGLFWSVGLGWNLHREKFMQNQSFVNNLKLRASYGVNGNDGIGNNKYQALFSASGYNDETARVLSQIGNPDLKWEENKPLDIGVDFAFFNHRISGTFDWYKRETKDLLQNVPISAANGLVEIAANIGSMENTGVEASLTTRNIVSNKGNFEWTTNLMFTSNRNEVTQLAEDNADIVGSTSITRVGEDYYTFYLPEYAGVDVDNGDALWYIDGKGSETTNSYNDANQVIIGRATPDFYGSMRNSFSYKGVELSFQFYTSWGGLLYDTWARYTNSDGSRSLSSTGNVNRGTYDRRWQQPGDVTDIPKFVYGNRQSGSSGQSSSRFVYDGSYIRLREVQLSYTLPSDITQKLNLTRLRFYVKGDNLWTWIKDDRLERDPEAGITGRLNQEIPISKTIFLGVNVSL